MTEAINKTRTTASQGRIKLLFRSPPEKPPNIGTHLQIIDLIDWQRNEFRQEDETQRIGEACYKTSAFLALHYYPREVTASNIFLRNIPNPDKSFLSPTISTVAATTKNIQIATRI